MINVPDKSLIQGENSDFLKNFLARNLQCQRWLAYPNINQKYIIFQKSVNVHKVS